MGSTIEFEKNSPSEFVPSFNTQSVENESNQLTPLYIAAENDSIKTMEFQESDAETASHMLEIGNPQPTNVAEVLSSEETGKEFEQIPFERIQKFMPESEWFMKKGHENSIHGKRHLSRVVTYANILAQTENLNENDTKIVSTAAGIHDLGRIDDRTDSDHGERSAKLFRDELTPKFAEKGLSYSLEDLDAIETLSKYHEWKYEDIPQEVRERKHGQLLNILMASDALDRFRLPREKWWPKEEFLRVEGAKKLLPVAKQLTLQTEKDYFVDKEEFIKSLKKRGEESGIYEPAGAIEVTESEQEQAEEKWSMIQEQLRTESKYVNGITPLMGIDIDPNSQAALVDIPLFRSETSAVDKRVRELAEKDPISKDVDLVEATWRYHLAEHTPNGRLFYDNAFFNQIKSGEPITLVHATPALEKIMKSGVIKTSGGCLGASIYTAPLRSDGKMHNLSQFVKEEQMERNKVTPMKTDLLLLEFQPETFRPNVLNGVDYLQYGPMQWDAFKTLQSERNLPEDVTREIISHFDEQLTPEVVDFLKLCSKYDELGTIPNNEFEKAFRVAQADFKYLGYPLFEAMTEYMALYQNDEQSKKLKDSGELNTYNYFDLAFGARPELYKHFNLKWFNPSFSDMSPTIEQMGKNGKGILDFSQDHFADFMKWRVAQQVRKSVGLQHKGKIVTPQPITDKDSLLAFGDQLPGLAGHITHRALRANHNWEQDHHYYEGVRAKNIWNNWDNMDTVFVTNSILPKGEVGFNLGTNAEYKVYKGEVNAEGQVVKSSGIPLDLRVQPTIIEANQSALRPHTGA